MNEKTQKWHDKDIEHWQAAQEDVSLALDSAQMILEDNNYVDLKSKTDGPTRAKMIVDVAGFILAQYRWNRRNET